MVDSLLAASNRERMWNSAQRRSRQEACPRALAPPRSMGTVCPGSVSQHILNYTHVMAEINRTVAEPVPCYVILQENERLIDKSSIFFLVEIKMLLPLCHILFRTPARNLLLFFVLLLKLKSSQAWLQLTERV